MCVGGGPLAVTHIIYNPIKVTSAQRTSTSKTALTLTHMKGKTDQIAPKLLKKNLESDVSGAYVCLHF